VSVHGAHSDPGLTSDIVQSEGVGVVSSRDLEDARTTAGGVGAEDWHLSSLSRNGLFIRIVLASKWILHPLSFMHRLHLSKSRTP